MIVNVVEKLFFSGKSGKKCSHLVIHKKEQVSD